MTGSAGSGDRISWTRSGSGPADTVHLYGETVNDTLPHCGGAGERVGFEEFIQEMQADGKERALVGACLDSGALGWSGRPGQEIDQGTRDQGKMTNSSGS